MNIQNQRPNRKPCSITGSAIVCQINAIAGFALGPNRERLNQDDLRAISAALCNTSLDIEAAIERRVIYPDDPEVDFG
jgi:hypothetical protein